MSDRVAPLRPVASVLLPVLAAVGACLAPASTAAQGARGSLTTTARYFEFRPVARDTVPRSDVTREDGEVSFEGRPAVCGPRVCTVQRPGAVADGVSLTQNLRATGWGFGVEGLSATVLLRSRFELGDDFVWPRSRDNVDAVLAYAQLVRDRFRVRLGRLQNQSGLGFTGYDGANVRARPVDGLRLEAYGGRSLARALNEPRNEILLGRDDFVLDEEAWLVGASAEVEPRPGTVLTARYQREIWGDRSGLVSERASLDLRTALLDPVRVEGSLDWDVGFGRLGKSHLRFRVPVPAVDLTVEGTYRHYVPYFELWTVWGFFDPTGYDEGGLRLTWTPRGDLGVWAGGGLRQYGDTGTDPVFGALEDQTTRFSLGGRWSPSPRWRLDAEYELENGVGAFLSSGQARARWEATPDLELRARATAFQQIQEFRVGEGTVIGAGLGGSVRLWEGIRFEGGVDVYRQMWENRPSSVDWNQVRGWSSLTVPFGGDPGRPDGSGR